MADRRRRQVSEGESEEDTGDHSRKERPSECESEGEHQEGEQDLSEYESANEDHGNGEEEEEEEEEESEEEEEDDDDDEEDDDEEEDDETATYDGDSVIIEEEYDGIDEERQSGDGEEQPAKDVDDDEDRQNPAFVPKKGAFYEHDMRIMMDEECEGEGKRPKKKLWKDDGKWIHDRYREDQQAPKSREELVALYGYDIRQYDKPPDAPMRSNSGRSRGRRSEQRPRLEDFVKEHQNRPPPSRRSPQSDFVERKNSYNDERRNSSNYYDKDQRYGGNNYQDNERSYHRSSSVEADEYGYSGKQERSYSRRTPDRQGDREYDGGLERGYRGTPERKFGGDNRGNNSYNSQDRGFDNRRNNYNYSNREERGSRGGRYSGRGPRRGSRGGGGDGGRRSYSDMRDSTNSRGRKFPPRFQQKQDRRYMQNSDYIDNDGEYDLPTTVVIDTSIPEPVTPPQSPPPETNVKSWQNIPSQNYQTSSPATQPPVSIAEEVANTSERKSYAKDRRGRTSGRIREQDLQSPEYAAAEQGMKQLSVQASPVVQDNIEDNRRGAGSPKSPSGTSPNTHYEGNQQKNYNKANNKGNSKNQDLSQQGRPKRYSSQRQRNVPDAPYPDTVSQTQVYSKPAVPPQENPAYYKPAFVKPDTPTTPTFRPALIQRPMFPIPVSTGAIPAQPPQVFARAPTNVTPVTLSTPVPIIAPPQYMNTGMIYGAPPPPFPVQGAPIPIPAFPSPPAVSTAQQPPPPSQQNQRQEVYRGGTTYYPPELQYKNPHVSPVRRLKSAIPIVDPQEIEKQRDDPGDNTQGIKSKRNSSMSKHIADRVPSEDIGPVSPSLESEERDLCSETSNVHVDRESLSVLEKNYVGYQDTYTDDNVPLDKTIPSDQIPLQQESMGKSGVQNDSSSNGDSVNEIKSNSLPVKNLSDSPPPEPPGDDLATSTETVETTA